jgi:hypothetical protein
MGKPLQRHLKLLANRPMAYGMCRYIFDEGMDKRRNENPIYVFLFWELCVLSFNFHIHSNSKDDIECLVSL